MPALWTGDGSVCQKHRRGESDDVAMRERNISEAT
jgi:hypothetical protein